MSSEVLEFAALMIEYGIGVIDERTYRVKGIGAKDRKNYMRFCIQ